ncbi:MAG: hypothetical protein ACRC62_05590 [Microcoleus sp.]
MAATMPGSIADRARSDRNRAANISPIQHPQLTTPFSQTAQIDREFKYSEFLVLTAQQSSFNVL